MEMRKAHAPPNQKSRRRRNCFSPSADGARTAEITKMEQHVLFVFSLINVILQFHDVKGCNVTLWPRVRFQHRFGAGPCFFRLPNRPSGDQQHWWIEIAFSSFQMGRSVLNQTCPSGHLKFVEETEDHESSSGTFCGRLSGDSQTYLTRAKSLTLYANPASEPDHFNAYFDVLSTEALRKRYPEMLRTNSLTPDDDNRGHQCDVLIRNCPNVCRLSSPLYPVSAYPRNVTCRYRVLFDRDDWQVVLGGQPGDRYDLGLHHPHQQHCGHHSDRLIVHEKLAGQQQYQQVAKFCGRGNFPKIIAQSGQVMVELITSSSGFFNQGFRLSVTHQRRKRSDHHSIISPCHHSIAAVAGQFYQQGSIVSPRHWFPRNVDCTWTLTSGRIWLEIHSKSNKLSSSSWTTTSHNNATCFHRLQLHRTSSDPAEQMTICESNSSSSAAQQLQSSTPTLLVRDRVQLRFTSLRGSMTGSEMDFNLFYMLLPEEVPAVADTLCDRILEEPNGTIDLIGDRLLLMRHKQLKCRYRFQAPDGDDYRIRIVIRQMVFDPIRQCEPGRDECSVDSDRQDFDWLLVSDRDLLHCFCQSSQEPTVVESASNRLDVQLDLKHIYDQSYKDPNIYRFQIDYAWIEDSGCGNPIEDDQGGMIRWMADPTLLPRRSNQSCTWLIEVPDNDRILLKINTDQLGDSADNCHVSLGYHGRQNDSRHHHQRRRLRQALAMDNRTGHLCSLNAEFISPFGLRYLHVQLETANNPRARFLLKWNVLFSSAPESPSPVDEEGLTAGAAANGSSSLLLFPCPDSNWSIPESLVCDGRINCPQQSLFGSLLDEESCTTRNSSYYQDYYYPWVMVLVVSFGFSVMISLASVSSHVRKWREVKTPITSSAVE